MNIGYLLRSKIIKDGSEKVENCVNRGNALKSHLSGY